MNALKRFLFWLAVAIIYWCCALDAVFWLAPVFEDGGGPMTSWYWSDHALYPTQAEYRDSAVERQFLKAYPNTASVVLLVGCCLPILLTRRTSRTSRRLFRLCSATSIALLLTLTAIQDIGAMTQLWHGPIIIMNEWYLSNVLRLAVVLIPLSLLAGAAAALSKSLEP